MKRKRESTEKELMCHCWWKAGRRKDGKDRRRTSEWLLGADNSLRFTVLKETDLNLLPVRTSDLNHKELYFANSLNKLEWILPQSFQIRAQSSQHLDFKPVRS